MTSLVCVCSQHGFSGRSAADHWRIRSGWESNGREAMTDNHNTVKTESTHRWKGASRGILPYHNSFQATTATPHWPKLSNEKRIQGHLGLPVSQFNDHFRSCTSLYKGGYEIWESSKSPNGLEQASNQFGSKSIKLNNFLARHPLARVDKSWTKVRKTGATST